MVPFSEVLRFLEGQDWVLYRIDPPYRIFCKHGDPNFGLPIYVEVIDRQVHKDLFERIRRIVEGENRVDPDEE